MTASLKEHRGRVADVRINANDTQAVSASYDGSCIIWDIVQSNRIMCLFESTMFKQVVYHPDESQLLTAGSDRKICYWDCYDGQAIRLLDGSETGELNALAIYQQGEHFISSGNDKVIKLWDYDEGINYYQGVGHSGEVTKVSILPRNLLKRGEEIVGTSVTFAYRNLVLFYRSPSLPTRSSS